MADMHRVEPDHTVTETRMDVVTTRPGALTRWLIDVRTCDATSASAQKEGSLAALFTAIDQEKTKRYGEEVWALGIERRGKLAPTAVLLLTQLAGEASECCEVPATTLLRQWRRALALVMAFEEGEYLGAAALPEHPAVLSAEQHAGIQAR